MFEFDRRGAIGILASYASPIPGEFNNSEAVKMGGEKSDYLNVKNFGAVGDGLNDDFSAIQSVIDSAISSQKSVYFPSGIYRITKGLVANFPGGGRWVSGVRIFGDFPSCVIDGANHGSVLLPDFDSAMPALSVIGGSNADNSHKNQVNGMLLENFGICGQRAPRSIGIHFEYHVNLNIRNVHIGFCGIGIRVNRRSNGSAFGYFHNVKLDSVFLVKNSEYAFFGDGAGALFVTFVNANFTENGAGINLVGCPLSIYSCGFFGNHKYALYCRTHKDESDSFGPVCIATRFETNGRGNSINSMRTQVILEDPKGASFLSCWFLGGTEGQNGIDVRRIRGGDITVGIHSCRFDGRKGVSPSYAVRFPYGYFPDGLVNCLFNGGVIPFLYTHESNANYSSEFAGLSFKLKNGLVVGGVLYQVYNGQLRKVV